VLILSASLAWPPTQIVKERLQNNSYFWESQQFFLFFFIFFYFSHYSITYVQRKAWPVAFKPNGVREWVRQECKEKLVDMQNQVVILFSNIIKGGDTLETIIKRADD